MVNDWTMALENTRHELYTYRVATPTYRHATPSTRRHAYAKIGMA